MLGKVLDSDAIQYNHGQMSKNLLGEEGIDLGTVNVHEWAFADDKIVTEKSVHYLQRMLSGLNTCLKIMGLKMNVNKPKIIVFERTNEETVCNITLGEYRIEKVNNYVYLASLFTNDGNIHGEISRRIKEGRKVTGSVRCKIRKKWS